MGYYVCDNRQVFGKHTMWENFDSSIFDSSIKNTWDLIVKVTTIVTRIDDHIPKQSRDLRPLYWTVISQSSNNWAKQTIITLSVEIYQNIHMKHRHFGMNSTMICFTFLISSSWNCCIQSHFSFPNAYKHRYVLCLMHSLTHIIPVLQSFWPQHC